MCGSYRTMELPISETPSKLIIEFTLTQKLFLVNFSFNHTHMLDKFFRLGEWRHSHRGRHSIGIEIGTRNQLRHNKHTTRYPLPLFGVRDDLRHHCHRQSQLKFCHAAMPYTNDYNRTKQLTIAGLNFRPSTISIEIILVQVMLAYLPTPRYNANG